VGSWTLGVPDFLYRRNSIDAAGGGTFDIEKDTAAAVKLQACSRRVTFRELEAVAAELHGSSEEIDPASKAASQFDSEYAKLRDDVGLGAGEATFNRIEPYLEELGKLPLAGGTALEAGGGHGLFIPDFSKRFDTVVFLDCSLVNIVVARKLAQDCGLDNVCFVRADATALPFASKSFDFVHEDNVIEHVADPTALVVEAVRVTSRSGTYVCLSPNRFSVAPEPHFRLPCFGFFPTALRRPLILKLRGVRTEAGTDPRSLRQLRSYLAAAGASHARIFFLPRYLRRTVRNTALRRLVRASLAVPVLGTLVSATINGPLLGLMPYHVALVSGGE
jgi:ubiquinone/menaquinone biosynthesis C-methylase UbiE